MFLRRSRNTESAKPEYSSGNPSPWISLTPTVTKLSTTSSRLEHQRTGNNFQVGNEKRNISNIQNLSPTQKAFQSNLNVR
uniref:Uncharacterized protein n=1 Tax=Salix viminalis TaxID=40686 RepID=A0A6N2NGG0_SALVM